MNNRDKSQESSAGVVGKGFFLRFLQQASTVLCKLNAVQKSLLVTAALTASLTSVFGANGAASGVFLSILAAPLTYLVLVRSKKNGWIKALIAFVVAICSLAVAFVVSAIAMVTSHQALIAAADGMNTFIYGSSVGARSRSYANKVISAVTIQSNAESMQKEIRFLLGSSQYKWLTPSQRTALAKKSEAVSSILAQSGRDKTLLDQLRSALMTKITSDNYKEILATATLLPKESRFNILVNPSDRRLLEERRQAALKQEQLEILKQQQIKEEEARRRAREEANREAEQARLDGLGYIRSGMSYLKDAAIIGDSNPLRACRKAMEGVRLIEKAYTIDPSLAAEGDYSRTVELIAKYREVCGE